MQKYDIKVALKPLFTLTAKDFTRVTVPPLQYLAVDGSGDPNTSAAYAEAIEALYSVSYTVKFASKSQNWTREIQYRSCTTVPTTTRVQHWPVALSRPSSRRS